MAMYKLPLALVLVASLVGEAAAFHTAAAMRPGSLAAHRSSAPAMATYQFVPQAFLSSLKLALQLFVLKPAATTLTQLTSHTHIFNDGKSQASYGNTLQ